MSLKVENPTPDSHVLSFSQNAFSDSFNEAEQFEQFADLEWSPPLFDGETTNSFQNDSRTLHEKHSLHTQEDLDLHDSKRHETSSEAEKKKPGRKPITNEPTTKRKAQNRAAQRAFRERKENHVKTLENRVAELEQQNNDKSVENQMLRAQILQLQSGSPGIFPTKKFTFDCPAPQVARTRSLEVLCGPNDNVPPVSACPSLYSSDSSPQTLPEKEFNAAAMPNFQRDHSYQESRSSSSDSAAYTQNSSTGEAGEKNTSVLPVDTDLTCLFSDSFTNQPIQYGFDPMNYRENNLYNSFEVDPQIFDNVDSVDVSKMYPDTSLQMSVSMDHESLLPGQDIVQSRPPQLNDQTDTDLAGEKEVGCPEVWRKIVAHPKFASFDLDSLCAEFSKKTSCTAGAPTKWDEEEQWASFDKCLDEFAERTTTKKNGN